MFSLLWQILWLHLPLQVAETGFHTFCPQTRSVLLRRTWQSTSHCIEHSYRDTMMGSSRPVNRWWILWAKINQGIMCIQTPAFLLQTFLLPSSHYGKSLVRLTEFRLHCACARRAWWRCRTARSGIHLRCSLFQPSGGCGGDEHK